MIRSVPACVVFNENVSSNGFKVRVRVPGAMPFEPGQFAHVLVAPAKTAPLLRRPFSVYDCFADGSETVVDFVYKVVGAGTEILSRKKAGEEIGVLGPLGNAFAISDPARTIYFVAGGVGIVPFYIFAKRILAAAPRAHVRLLFGARFAGEHLCIDEFRALPIEVLAATDDGSEGFRGLVTDLLRRELRERGANAEIFACGPDAMCVSTVRAAREFRVPCRVSLERRMGCALGACRACVVKVRTGNGDWKFSRICCEGTVYDAADLVLEQPRKKSV